MLNKHASNLTGILLGIFLALYFVLIYLYQAPLLNNGDYHRTVHELVQIPAYIGLDHACLPINPDRFFIPHSLASLVFEFNVIIASVFDSTCWNLQGYFLLLSAIYLYGLYRCFVNQLPLLSLLGLIAALLFFSPFLKSLYEEGLILALLPWVVLGIDQLRTKGKMLRFIISCALLILVKAQLVLLAPVVLYTIIFYGIRLKASSAKIFCATAMLVLAVVGSLYQKHMQADGIANAYNRLFNGIGWSMQEVHAWPANRFGERLKYFSNHQFQLQEKTNAVELFPNLTLWGTSYWPTGLELLTSGNDLRWQQIEEKLKPTFFLKFIYKHPDVLAQYFQNGVLIFITSNYAFGALQEIQPSMIGAQLAAINHYGLQTIIWIYALLLIYFLITRTGFGRILVMTIFLGVPFAVILGDGFFEFEKHLMPYFLTLPLLLLFIPSKSTQ